MKSTEGCREQVKAAESHVMRSATEVSEGEASLGASQNHRAQVAQKLQQLEAGIAELTEQIRTMETRREAEAGKVRIAKTHHEDATVKEHKSDERLSALRKSEEDARVSLEECRQKVKNQQRSCLDIETQMETSRELLTLQRGSLADIQETIDHLTGGMATEDEKTDSLLF